MVSIPWEKESSIEITRCCRNILLRIVIGCSRRNRDIIKEPFSISICIRSNIDLYAPLASKCSCRKIGKGSIIRSIPSGIPSCWSCSSRKLNSRIRNEVGWSDGRSGGIIDYDSNWCHFLIPCCIKCMSINYIRPIRKRSRIPIIDKRRSRAIW